MTYIFAALFSNFVARGGGGVNLRGKSNRNLIVPFCLPPFARSKQRTHLVVQSSQEEEIQLDSNTHREDHIGSQIMAGSICTYTRFCQNLEIIRRNKFGIFELIWHLTLFKELPNQSITLVIKCKFLISNLSIVMTAYTNKATASYIKNKRNDLQL